MIASFFTSLLLGGLLSGATPTTKPTDAKPADSKKEAVAQKSEWISLFNGNTLFPYTTLFRCRKSVV